MKSLNRIKLLTTVENCKFKTKSYCLKCRKDTDNLNPNVLGTSNGKAIIFSKCAICGNEKSRFIKNQGSKGLLSNLGLETPLNKVPMLSDIFFWECKMNEVVNKFFISGW